VLVAWSLFSLIGLDAGVALAGTKPASLDHGRRLAPAPLSQASSPANLCAQVGLAAGFSESGNLVTAVAVGMAESNCNPFAQYVNGPTPGCPNGSVDRGLWQINNCYHPEVSDACAYAAQCNANAAYTISSQGTNWTPWATYNSGAYRNYIGQAQTSVNALFGPTVALTGSATAFVFWDSTTRNLYQAQGGANAPLQGPYNRGMGPLGSPPAAALDGSAATYVYWKGTDRNLWEAYWNGTQWTGPYNRGMGPLGSPPTVAIRPSGWAYVFWEGTDANLYEARGYANGPLEGPIPRGGGPLGSAPTAGVDSNGSPYVYWKGTDNGLWETYWNGAQWVGPYGRGMGPLSSAPSVAVTSNGNAYVFWQSTDGNLFQASGAGNGPLGGPVNLGMGPLGSAPTAGVDSGSATYVYWKGTDNNLWEGYWNGSQWVGPLSRGMGPLR
jgi:hypothetical protein